MTLLVRFHPYIGFHNENRLFYIVLHTDEQNCASHVCTDGRYTELCVWGDAVNRLRGDKTGVEWIMQLPLH